MENGHIKVTQYSQVPTFWPPFQDNPGMSSY